MVASRCIQFRSHVKNGNELYVLLYFTLLTKNMILKIIKDLGSENYSTDFINRCLQNLFILANFQFSIS